MGYSIKYKSACARMAGRSHISTNTPCQDYVCTQRDGLNGLISISLSDGAGSCNLSHIGSRIIVKTVNNYLIKNFNVFLEKDTIKIKEEIIEEIRKNLYTRAKKDNQESIKAYSGTLLAVITNGFKYIALHLGDGVIGYIKNNMSFVLSEPLNGEYSNTTYFVTDKDATSSLRVYLGKIDTINSFVLMSDGTQDSLYDKKNNSLASAYIKLSEWLDKYSEKKVTKILNENIKEIFTKKSTDDCSIGMLNILKISKGENNG